MVYNIKEYEGVKISLKLKGISAPLVGQFVSSGVMVDVTGSLVYIDGVFRIDDSATESGKTEIDIEMNYIESIEIIGNSTKSTIV